MASSGSSGPADGRGRPRAAGRAIYGGLPESGPPGFAPRLLELADELRREGLAVGTSEMLDAFHALGELSWTAQEDFREALAATLAKSQEDRRVFEIVFDRFFFRAVEREAVERGLTEKRFEGGDRLDFDQLRERIREAVRQGSDGEMRDMARLAIAAFGRQGEGSGVIGVDVQRIRRALELKGEAGGRELPDPESVPHKPLRELDRALPSGPLQDLAAVHRVVAQLKRRLATHGHEAGGRRRSAVVDFRRTMRSSLETGGVPMRIRYRQRRPRRPGGYVLCDVSTSVTSASG